jgi:hypothetical protein
MEFAFKIAGKITSQRVTTGSYLPYPALSGS